MFQLNRNISNCGFMGYTKWIDKKWASVNNMGIRRWRREELTDRIITLGLEIVTSCFYGAEREQCSKTVYVRQGLGDEKMLWQETWLPYLTVQTKLIGNTRWRQFPYLIRCLIRKSPVCLIWGLGSCPMDSCTSKWGASMSGRGLTEQVIRFISVLWMLPIFFFKFKFIVHQQLMTFIPIQTLLQLLEGPLRAAVLWHGVS